MLIHNAQVTGSLILNGADVSSITGSSAFSSSFSSRISTIESKYATTGSNQFSGSQTITGSLNVTGQIVTQILNVQTVSSSVVYSSGSNVFGNSLANTQVMTGSVSVTGSLTVNGSSAVLSNQTSSTMFVQGGNSFGTQALIGTNDTQNLALETSGSIRMFVSSSGFVGIGTTSPGSRLDVSGAGRFAGTAGVPAVQIISTGTSFGVLGISGSQAGDVNWLVISGYPNAGDFTIRQSDTLDAITIKKTTGNVGIGTTSPSSTYGTLTVAGTGITIANDGNAKLQIGRYSAGASNSYIKLGANSNSLRITNNTDTVDIFTIENGGNVGIGTTAPSAKLTIDAASILTNTQIDLIGNSSSGPKGHIGQFANNLYLSSNWFYNGSQNADSTSYGQANITLNAGTTTTSTIDFSLSDAGATSPGVKVRILSNGNVGIGTTSPASILHIVGTESRFGGVASGFISVYNATGRSGYLQANGGNDFRIASDTDPMTYYVNGSERMRITSGGLVGIGGITPTAGNRFWVRGTSTSSGNTTIYADNSSGTTLFMVRDNGDVLMPNGNVGIGTTSPISRLTIDGDFADMTGTITYSTNTRGIIINQDAGGGFGTGVWFRQAGLTAGIGSTRVSSGDWATDLRFYTHPSSTTNQNILFERMRINSEGNVGIGTTSPNGKMTVIGNTVDIRNTSGGYGTGYAIELSTNANIPRIDWIDNGVYTGNIKSVSGEFIINNSSNNALILQTANAERMRITSGGNVGIGTTSPNVTGFGGARVITVQADIQPVLELIGSTYNTTGIFGGGAVQFRNTSTAVGTVGVENLTGNQGNMVFYTNNGTSNTERMRITSGGYLKASNVGTYVGSTNSWHELRTNNAGEPIVIASAGNGSYGGVGLQVRVNRTSTGGNYLFLQAWDEAASTARFRVLDSGNVENTNGSYGTISDISLKENIIDATPKLSDILNLKVKNFNLKADENKLKQIGFIAQEFEEVFPSMIDTDQKTGLKSIKTSVLIPVLVKAIQELKSEIDQLKSSR